MADTKKTVYEMFNDTLDFLVANHAPEEIVGFVQSRADQVVKASESAKAARAKKNGGEKKDVAQAGFYVALREKIYPVLTTAATTGDELLAKIDNKTPNGKAYLAAQVAVAMKPLVEDGTVLVAEKKVTYIDKKGLKQEALRKAYSLA